MKKLFVLSLSLMLVCGMTTSVLALSYTGTVSGPSAGLYGTEEWSTASLSWEVTNDGVADGNWQYTYVWEAETGSKGLSHLDIEVSEAFGDENLISWQAFYKPADTWEDITDDTVQEGPQKFEEIGGTLANGLKWESGKDDNDNDLWPDDIYKFQVIFVSDKDPVWGDFYAKDGKTGGDEVYAYNTGFGVDPYSQLGLDTSLKNGPLFSLDQESAWILRPDSTSNGVIPEPSTVFLLSIGLLGVLGLGRKIKK